PPADSHIHSRSTSETSTTQARTVVSTPFLTAPSDPSRKAASPAPAAAPASAPAPPASSADGDTPGAAACRFHRFCPTPPPPPPPRGGSGDVTEGNSVFAQAARVQAASRDTAR
ncbi:unnamed protein product, partial [Ectocarpus sp. 8 AP-2014]